MSRNTFQSIAELLAQDPRVRLVYGFGSAMQAPERARDVDVGVLLARALTWDEERELRSRVSLAAPEVDLVILNEAPPVLRYEVVAGGRCLFARSAVEQAEFEIQALSRFQDFQPMRRVQQQYLRERVEERRGPAR